MAKVLQDNVHVMFLPCHCPSVINILWYRTVRGKPLRNYVRVLDDMVRVLRPGGVMIVTFPFIYGECDVQDFRRWTLFGMIDELERAGCTVIKAEPRGGAAFATVACWSSAINNLVPGGRKSWRAERSMKGYFREAFLQVIGLPLTLLGWLAVVLDKMLPQSGVYMGGIVFVAKAKGQSADR